MKFIYAIKYDDLVVYVLIVCFVHGV